MPVVAPAARRGSADVLGTSSGMNRDEFAVSVYNAGPLTHTGNGTGRGHQCRLCRAMKTENFESLV